jgi:ParB/Sulfiredoxin domain
MKVIKVPLSAIQRDERAQPRLELNASVIDEYAAALKAGAKLPPIDVFQTPEGMILADGYHRVEAAKLAGLTELAAAVHAGDRRAAILHAVGANAAHGLRRSNADKRRAVLTLLQDPEWRQWSDREIADQCRVSRPLVAELRAEVEAKTPHPAELQDSNRTVKRSGNVYSMNIANMRGKSNHKLTLSTGSPDAKLESLSWMELLLALPHHSTFQMHPAGLASRMSKRGFRSNQARQLEGFFMRLAVFLERYEPKGLSASEWNELANLSFRD